MEKHIKKILTSSKVNHVYLKNNHLLTNVVSVTIGALINGELFLSLPDDAELLQKLNLSLAFERLVVRKAMQVG